MVFIEIKKEVIYGLSNGIRNFDPRWPFGGQRSRSNPKNFEVEYLENGTR